MIAKMTKMCLGRCGRRVPANALNTRCLDCNADMLFAQRARGHWSQGRDRGAQDRFRRALMARAGGRCEFVEGGVRCLVTAGLQAHHTSPGDDTAGLMLCRSHHRQVDPHAR